MLQGKSSLLNTGKFLRLESPRGFTGLSLPVLSLFCLAHLRINSSVSVYLIGFLLMTLREALAFDNSRNDNVGLLLHAFRAITILIFHP